MTDLLNWIARNQGVAFVIGVFILIFAGIVAAQLRSFFNFIHNCLCAVTGKYPAPRPVVQCDGNCKREVVCRCCEDGCDEDQCDCQNV